MLDTTERLTLMTCSFLSGCILLGPGEWRAALGPFAIAGGLLAWHLKLRRDTRRAASPTAPSPPTSGAATAGPAPGEASSPPAPSS